MPLVRWRLNARVRVNPGSAPGALNEEISGTQAGKLVRSQRLHAGAFSAEKASHSLLRNAVGKSGRIWDCSGSAPP